VRSAEIRQQFLRFFAAHQHEVVPSASLIPHNDPTLFFVNAGMVPFKDLFTGQETRSYTRATSVQKCLRVSGKHNDLENVGRTPRHHTLFEMLGNFSFGDYFKQETVEMAWTFLVGELGLPEERLWVTVFEEDDEAWDIWRSLGVPESRLQRLDAKENFWSMGETGPCGPCSEIFFDHGPTVSADTRGPAGGDDRYVEIWNLVFMQYEQRADGSRIALPTPSIDTGSGLERLTAALQGVTSNYDTDLFQGLLKRTASVLKTPYGRDAEIDTAMRVIADHARATAFLIADGVMPSNEGRGYVLRRIMRRAIRFGVKSGMNTPFFHQISDQVIADFSAAYPELGERSAFIHEIVQAEEDRFRSTLGRGTKLLDSALDQVGAGGQISGEVAFTLSDTYGFPIDLTRLMAAEQDVGVDEAGFTVAMEAQRARGRAAWKGSGETEVGEIWAAVSEQMGHTLFCGYPTTTHDGTQGMGSVMALFERAGKEQGLVRVQSLQEGQTGVVLLDQTPFYAEAGGQLGDRGMLSTDTLEFRVDDTAKAAGLHLHRGTVSQGTLTVGDGLTATVNAKQRDAIRRNHTATHLLHAALRNALGEHVTQKGSLVGPDRLRFDFSHHKAMTPDELKGVEAAINHKILRNIPLSTQEMSLDEAKTAGAMALFGEKYDAQVRVVAVPGYSVELCGGTHVDRTGSMGSFVITSEAGIAAGVRRIEAQTGHGALAWCLNQRHTLLAVADQLKVQPKGAAGAIQKLQQQRKELERELAAMKRDVANAAAGDLLSQAREFGGVKVLAAEFDGDLKEQVDRLRSQLGTSLVVLASAKGDKALIVAAATSDIAGKRVHAGHVIKLIAPLIGGGGGGRPDMAQAGGKNPAGIPTALETVYHYAKEQLGQ
jgi:alanyl-tRNA synthetase